MSVLAFPHRGKVAAVTVAAVAVAVAAEAAVAVAVAAVAAPGEEDLKLICLFVCIAE